MGTHGRAAERRREIARTARVEEGRRMLRITTSAATAIEEIRDRSGVPAGFALRVYQQDPITNGVHLRLGFVPEPARDDEVIQTPTTTVCVAPELAEPLSDGVISARQTPQGPELVLLQ
jgi:Fe-S cluster assembly iron-binding protein IscA